MSSSASAQPQRKSNGSGDGSGARRREWRRALRKQNRRRDYYKAVLRRFGPFTSPAQAYEVLRARGLSSGNGYVKLGLGSEWQEWMHRVVMAIKVGRKLRKGEEVHHLDENGQNNHPDNLELCEGRLEHCAAHGGEGTGLKTMRSGHRIFTTGPNIRRTVARTVMELHLGRKLRKDEVVLHLNGDPGDDRLQNLAVVPMGFNLRFWRQEKNETAKEKSPSRRRPGATESLARGRNSPRDERKQRAG